MATFKAGFQGIEYTLTASAVQPFGTTDNHRCQQIILTAAAANTQPCWVGLSNLTATTNRLIEIKPGASISIGPFAGGFIDPSQLFAIGTASEKLFIAYVRA